MTAWGIYALIVIAMPIVCGTSWLTFAQLRARTRQPGPRSVTAIAHRVALETGDRPVRWPRADPDHGRLTDNRPTRVIPTISKPEPAVRVRRHVGWQPSPRPRVTSQHHERAHVDHHHIWPPT